MGFKLGMFYIGIYEEIVRCSFKCFEQRMIPIALGSISASI